MTKTEISELYAELDATDEEFVRSKQRRGGYARWQRRHVDEWLAEQQHRRQSQYAWITAKWTAIGAVAALASSIAAVGAILIGR